MKLYFSIAVLLLCFFVACGDGSSASAESSNLEEDEEYSFDSSDSSSSSKKNGKNSSSSCCDVDESSSSKETSDLKEESSSKETSDLKEKSSSSKESSDSKEKSSSSKESSDSKETSSSKKIDSGESSSSSVVYRTSYAEVVDENVGEGFVKIGNQIWMDHNLTDGAALYVFAGICYENDEKLCDKYGMLTDWIGASNYLNYYRNRESAIIDVVEPRKGYCPDGSHLPSKAELEELMLYLRDHPFEEYKITNLLGGMLYDRKGFSGLDSVLILWSSTHDGAFNIEDRLAYAWGLHYTKETGLTLESMDRNIYGNARCIKDENSQDSYSSSSSVRQPVLTNAEGCGGYTRENWEYLNPNVEYGCIKDKRDGRFYKTVIIKDRVWLAENLRYVSKKTSYCYTTVGDECDIYGRYYSGYALKEEPSICPEGFHLPTEHDVDSLRTFLITDLLSAKGWDVTAKMQYEPANSTGFSILATGLRTGTNTEIPVNIFTGMGFSASLWTAIPYNGEEGFGEMSFFNRTDTPDISVFGRMKNWAVPVRCIDD